MKVKSNKWYGWFWPPERRKIKMMQAISDHQRPKIEKNIQKAWRDHILYGKPLPKPTKGQIIMSTWDISDWQFMHTPNKGDAITLKDTKTIVVDCSDTPMLLHELAHAISGQGHTGYFADIFTELVRLNMEDKDA